MDYAPDGVREVMQRRFGGGKSSESEQCTITGPCLRMRHRLSA